MKKKGRVWKFGDNVDYEQIISSKYAFDRDPDKFAQYCLIDLDPEFPKEVKKGDIIVAGENFGRGSTHIQGHIIFQELEISIIASSIYRHFLRNGVRFGIPMLKCDEITAKVDKGDRIEADFRSGLIKNLTKNITVSGEPLPSSLLNMIEVGGTPHFVQRNRGWGKLEQ